MALRSIRALLLTVILGAASVTAAGFHATEFGPAPEYLELPAMEVGDYGAYDVQFFNRTEAGWIPNGPVMRGIEFRNPGPEWLLDVDGQPRLGSGIETDVFGYNQRSYNPAKLPPVWGPTLQVQTVSSESGHYLATRITSASSFSTDEAAVAVGNLTIGSYQSQNSENSTHEFLSNTPSPEILLCGLVNPYAGHRQLVAGKADLGPCKIPVIDMALPGSRSRSNPAITSVFVLGPFTVLGTDTIDGAQTLVLERKPAIGEGGDPSIQIWLSPNSAAPVQVVLFMDGWAQALRLVDYGNTRPTPPGAEPKPAPVLTWVPRQPWGMDDRDSDHFFPASSAWAAARDDSEVAAFFAKHPEAVAASVSAADSSDESTARVTWFFEVTDGIGALTITVEATGIPWFAPTSLPPLGPAGPRPHMDAEVTVERRGPEGLQPPDQLPRYLPSAGTLTRAWAAHVGAESPATEWGFAATCWMGPCGAPGWTVAAGNYLADRRTDALSNPGDVRTQVAQADSELMVFSGGDKIISGLQTSGWSNLAPSPESEPTAPLAPGDEQIAWRMPSGTVAATTSLLAALVGLLYYFWPHVKTGALGLFSRLRQDQVLHHPVRQQLLGHIEQEPGIHFQELVRRANAGRSTVEHHLRHLEQRGHVLRRNTQGYTCFVPKGTDRRVLAGAGAARSPGAKAVLAAIEQAPGASIAEAARTAGLERSTAHHHVKRLMEAGLVERRRDGRTVRLWRAGAA